MLFQLIWHERLGPYQVNISTAITSSVTPQLSHPEAHKSCLWSRIKPCPCSPASKGRSGGEEGRLLLLVYLPALFSYCGYILLHPDNKGSCLSCSETCNVRKYLRKGTKRQVVRLHACNASWCNHRPGMHHFSTGEILFLNIFLLIHWGITCATYAHIRICSKH